tara:strand:+ start:3736 stop:4668 length:933 start_codon:yes stop_codon:yes gene_type:complete
MSSINKNALVFGGAGFLGSHVADALTEEGYHVKIFDCRNSPYLQPSQEMIVGDIMDLDKVKKAVQGCDIVYNFAGVADIDEARFNPKKTANYNIIGTIHTLEAARQAKVGRYAYASSIYVYSNQGSFYRASKQAAERFIETYQEVYELNYTILRYGSLYGRRADSRNMIYKLLSNALQNKKMVYPGSGSELREYINVLDAARASIKILDQEYANQHIVITGNEKMRVKDLMTMISEITGSIIEHEFTGKEIEGHYFITPYSFNPKIGKKLVATYHIDMGQGLIDCLAELHQKSSSNLQIEEDWLLNSKDN